VNVNLVHKEGKYPVNIFTVIFCSCLFIFVYCWCSAGARWTAETMRQDHSQEEKSCVLRGSPCTSFERTSTKCSSPTLSILMSSGASDKLTKVRVKVQAIPLLSWVLYLVPWIVIDATNFVLIFQLDCLLLLLLCSIRYWRKVSSKFLARRGSSKLQSGIGGVRQDGLRNRGGEA
jgi:hypothetical protein